MLAPAKVKKASSDSAPSSGKRKFYLKPRTKILILATCLTLMIAGSVYAVLQPLNPEPLPADFSESFWYPRETNPNARLQAVTCANDYACRLNSVAVNGTGDRAEAWAVGNVSLVLHRKAGEKKWEQLNIMATDLNAVSPSQPTPTPLPTPGPARRSSPTPTPSGRISTFVPPTPTPTPTATPPPTTTPTPLPTLQVPSLLGLSRDEAQKAAFGSGFQISFEYEAGSAPAANSSVQQGPPPNLRVVRQTPEPKSVAPPKSTITVTLGRARSGARLLLDTLIPTVQAAELERPPRQQATPPQQPTPSQTQQTGSRANVSGRRSPNTGNAQAGGSVAATSPAPASPLVDDLIYVGCSEQGCRALGRTGRIYRISNGPEWGYIQAGFTVTTSPAQQPSLVYAGNWERILAKSGNAILRCAESGPVADFASTNVNYVCAPEPGSISATDDNLLKRSLPNGKVGEFSEGYPIKGAKDAEDALIVGEAGVIRKIKQRDGSSRLIPSGTTAALRSFGFGASTHGFVVGDQGIILSTTDDGNTWRHETRGPEGAIPNHRLPAPWYWVLAFLLIVTCSLTVAAPPPPVTSEFSVADWAVTDAPLKPGDFDSLDFTPMALGLSRFIRNPKTQPPVTIAIEGEWGEGKSSVMSLLRGDLEKSRYRPVWFNAWHHQSEEQLLAALLEHIKDESVPPWWHIDNWIFRARLLRIRLSDKWPLAVILILGLCGSVSFELSRHGLRLDDFTKFTRDCIQLAKYLLPWSTQASPPDDLAHFGLVATVLAMFVAIFSKAKTFGIDPSKLTDNLRNAAAIKDVKPEPGIRRQFASEFGDLCDAWCWGGRRVIIFIDDLDRCRPESVVTVLESINFLTTAGECVIVLGMAQNQVTHCVGLSFKDIAQAEEAYRGGGNTEQEKAVARFNYGAFYIKKLVNIIARLPKTTPEQRRRVLDIRAAEVRRQDQDEKAANVAHWRTDTWDWLSVAGKITLQVAPVFALVLAVLMAVLVGYRQGTLPASASQTSAVVAAVEKPTTASTPTPTPTPVQAANSKEAKPLAYHPTTTSPATLTNPDNNAVGGWWSYVVDLLFLAILFGILAYQLTARTNQDAQNSPQFEEALDLWGPYIVGVCDTPREIKRALNDLRYQAMTRRNNGPSATRAERLMRTLRQFVTGQSEKAAVETQVDEAALPPRKAAELANLTPDEWNYFLDPTTVEVKGSENLKRLIELKAQHVNRFKRWIAEPTLNQSSGSPMGVEEQNVAARGAGQS